MQSQLEAALLGTISANLNTSITLDDDENNLFEEDGEDVEDFIDEDIESENGTRNGKHFAGNASTCRTVTLQMLLAADILQPGRGTMSIEYLGQRFVGDLLEDGKIRSQETNLVFASPSAWAIACKRFINPEKKSGCGWASIRYRGKKLDAYKNIWYRKKKEEKQELDLVLEIENLMKTNMANAMQYHRVVVKHNTIANRTLTHDVNTLIECTPFSNLGKIQPFLVSIATNAALLMDFHCHLMKTEVSGYLAGHWDVNSHSLQITRAYPCRCLKSDRELAPHIEAEISASIEREKLTLVGWYHSHPFAAATPTLRDIDAQLDYEIKMKGVSESSYTPCIGFIISPYNYEDNSLESSIIAYWVIPPPETKPNEYGRPMLMSYSVIQDSAIFADVKDEMKKCVDYYKRDSSFVNFGERYLNNTTYVDKLKSSLISKFPRDGNEASLWHFTQGILDMHTEEKESLLSIPSISKSSQLLNNLSSSQVSNLMLPTDISNMLFNSGSFPSASSLLGLPDPMAHSTLAANNMFLSTNLFKMQELLRPLSSSSPITSTKSNSDTNKKQSSIKIPAEIKNNKSGFAADLLNLKNKLDFIAPDLNLSGKSDYSSKLDSNVPNTFSALDFTLDLSKNSDDTKSSKINYSTFDLSTSGDCNKSGGTDSGSQAGLSVSGGNNDDKPLNLAGD